MPTIATSAHGPGWTPVKSPSLGVMSKGLSRSKGAGWSTTYIYHVRASVRIASAPLGLHSGVSLCTVFSYCISGRSREAGRSTTSIYHVRASNDIYVAG